VVIIIIVLVLLFLLSIAGYLGYVIGVEHSQERPCPCVSG
jgi:hypothetical protein